MSIITLIRRRIRLARLADARTRQAWLRRTYCEQMSGLARHIDDLERDHVLDVARNGPSSREIARGIESQAKAGLFAR